MEQVTKMGGGSGLCAIGDKEKLKGIQEQKCQKKTLRNKTNKHKNQPEMKCEIKEIIRWVSKTNDLLHNSALCPYYQKIKYSSLDVSDILISYGLWFKVAYNAVNFMHLKKFLRKHQALGISFLKRNLRTENYWRLGSDKEPNGNFFKVIQVLRIVLVEWSSLKPGVLYGDTKLT